MKFKQIIILILIILLSAFLIIFFNKEKESNNINKLKEEDLNLIELKVNGYTLTIQLENNTSAKAFYEKLKEGDIVVEASDYGNFEKVGDLGFTLPTNDTNIETKPGDIILYQGDKITVYYDTNTWEFTKLGSIIDVDNLNLKEILGSNDVTLFFSIKEK